MLTKEECKQALRYMQYHMVRDYNLCNGNILKPRFQRKVDIIKQLIEEHFYLLEKYKILQDENGRLTFNNIANNINDMNYKLWLDNPPLKLEELKKGMWIWDNKYKDYIHLRDNCSLRGPLYWSCEIVGEGYVHTFEYEENRFYRKQVVE